MKVKANGITLEVEDTGSLGPQDTRPVVLVVMGLGLQLISWPEAFVQGLVDAGFRVVRFDNRDIGLSQGFDHLGVPNLVKESLKYRLGLPIHAPYTLVDMAQDGLGVLDALGIAEAHVVGMSMGGMIAQRMTLLAPQRVRTLTSVMSSSGARYLPGPRADVVQALIARPGRSEEAIVNHIVRLFRLIGSPAYPIPEETLRDYARASVRRSYRPAGTARQMLAITADTRRADELPRIKRPTLVLHGRDDPLVPLACGIDTARRIAGARLHVIDGMGHDLAPGVLELLLPRLCEHLMEERRG